MHLHSLQLKDLLKLYSQSVMMASEPDACFRSIYFPEIMRRVWLEGGIPTKVIETILNYLNEDDSVGMEILNLLDILLPTHAPIASTNNNYGFTTYNNIGKIQYWKDWGVNAGYIKHKINTIK